MLGDELSNPFLCKGDVGLALASTALFFVRDLVGAADSTWRRSVRWISLREAAVMLARLLHEDLSRSSGAATDAGIDAELSRLGLFFFSFLGTRALGEAEGVRLTGRAGESLSLLLLASAFKQELSEFEPAASSAGDLLRPRRNMCRRLGCLFAIASIGSSACCCLKSRMKLFGVTTIARRSRGGFGRAAQVDQGM